MNDQTIARLIQLHRIENTLEMVCMLALIVTAIAGVVCAYRFVRHRTVERAASTLLIAAALCMASGFARTRVYDHRARIFAQAERLDHEQLNAASGERHSAVAANQE